MKPRHQNPLRLAARSSGILSLRTITFCVLSAGHALAQATWDGGGTADEFGNYNWADGPNWLAESAPVAGNTLNFGGTVNTTTSFNNIAADTSFAGITFDSTAGAFNLSGNRVTLGGNVVNNDADLQTINLDMLMNATRTFDTASGNMLVGGILSGSTGSVGLTKTGASTLTLANVNTYTGNTSVQNGTLVLRGGDDNRLATTSAVVLGNNAALPAATIGTLQLGDSNGASNQTLTSLTRSGANTSAVVGGHSSVSTLTINTSGGVTFDGVLGGGGTNQNNLALTKEGSGTLSLTGNNTYTGTTHIKEGTISGVAGNNRISTGSLLLGDSASNTSGVLVIGNTGSARSQTVSSITTAGTGTGNRVVGAHGTNSTLTVNNSTTVTYDGFLGGTGTNQNNLNLIKSGSGTLVLTQANSYVGNTTINAGGILRVGNNSAFGTTGSVTLTGTGAILELADGITINRGLTVANAGDNKIIQLQDGATSGEYSGAITINEALINDFDLLAFAGGTLTVSGQIGASAGANITKEGAGTVVVSGDNSAFNKSVSIHAGILRAGNSNAFGSTGGITLANTDTALELANGVTINRGLTINQLGDKKTLALQDGAAAAEYSGGILIKESTHGNVEVSVGNAGTLTISGAVTSEQAAGLTKTGAGTLILSSTLNAYTGNTTISGGKLVVTESIATSTVIVGGSGAILASDTTATIGSTLAVNNGAILAIGDAANATTATATVLGATTFNNGSIFSWDINAAGTSYDKLVTTNVLGQASPAGDAVFRIVVADTGFVNNFWASNQTWSDVFTTDGTAAIANWADVFGSAVSVVNSSFATFTPAAGTFSITGSSLTWTAVPEPTGTLAGLLITAGLIRRRRA